MCMLHAQTHCVSELLASVWAYMVSLGRWLMSALGSPALEVESCLPGGLDV